jgi:choline dehydrogenase-like flavoprotein
VIVTDSKFVLAAGAVYSAVLLLASADHKHPRGLSNSSDQVGRNLMMHNNAHIVAIDLNRHNDVTFQKTLSINDWYLNGGDGFRWARCRKSRGATKRSPCCRRSTPSSRMLTRLS